MEHARLPWNLAVAAVLLTPINARYLGTLQAHFHTCYRPCNAKHAMHQKHGTNMKCTIICTGGGRQSPSLPPSLAEHYLCEDFPAGRANSETQDGNLVYRKLKVYLHTNLSIMFTARIHSPLTHIYSAVSNWRQFAQLLPALHQRRSLQYAQSALLACCNCTP